VASQWCWFISPEYFEGHWPYGKSKRVVRIIVRLLKNIKYHYGIIPALLLRTQPGIFTIPAPQQKRRHDLFKDSSRRPPQIP